MKTTENPNHEQTKKVKHLSPWLAYPLAIIVWWVLPWAISWLTPRYGWTDGHPNIWNILGLIPVVIGTIGLLWGVAVHSAASPQGIEWELDKSYLLMRGMYTFSRHPMYLSELILLFGWVIFYGNVIIMRCRRRSVFWRRTLVRLIVNIRIKSRAGLERFDADF
jgi:protein-S-isoprenylcysteine O-methyltransferase Ste14